MIASVGLCPGSQFVKQDLGHGLWNSYLGCLSFNQGIFSGPLTITQTSYWMMFSVISDHGGLPHAFPGDVRL